VAGATSSAAASIDAVAASLHAQCALRMARS